MSVALDDGLLLALDQGGHASRAVVYDSSGQAIAEAQVPVETRREALDRVEHDADELASSLLTAAQDACDSRAVRGRKIVAAGLACQRSTVVCWDRRDGRALSPALSWQDRRDAGWLERLRPRADGIRRRTGLVLSPHYGANKLRWCLAELRAVHAAADEQRLAAGPLSSFLLHRLLAERPVCVDPANAARTLLFDPATRDWVPELLADFGIPRHCLPTPVPTRHAYGSLQVGGRSIPLTACTGDQAASVFAFGEPGLDRAWFNAGTGAFLQRAVASGTPLPDGLLMSVLWSDATSVVCSLEATVNGAGSALAWLQSRVALDLTRALDSRPAQAASDAPIFVNGVGGLGSPWWKPDFPTGFVGAGDEAAQLDAVVESIAFMAVANLARMREAGPLAGIVMTGGLARSGYLCQVLADLGALPVERPRLTEATAQGIAYLAGNRPPRWPVAAIEGRFLPQRHAALEERHARWRAEMTRLGA